MDILPRKLGTIFNNDEAISYGWDEKTFSPDTYLHTLNALLDLKPGVLAQCVGMPDVVTYPSRVTNSYDKHMDEVVPLAWPDSVESQKCQLKGKLNCENLFKHNTDTLKLTIRACRKRGVLVLADYRMNSEDWYQATYLLSDLGRAHPEWRINKNAGKKDAPVDYAGCLDPAVPEVFEHRMKIFTEVAETYDIDGIEFDFRRWYHMVSNPLENHVVLTRMVRETRKMLDEVGRRKGSKKLLLGVRVGPSLDSEPNPFIFPGIFYPFKPINASCRELGLDVKTWIKEELVDYVCPALFLATLPGIPLVREFADLAKGTNVGIYPTLWPLAAWQHGVCERRIELTKEDQRAQALYKYDLCTTALEMYNQGADGISTFNWYSYYRDAKVPYLFTDGDGSSGPGADAIQSYIYPLLGNPAGLRDYLARPWAFPPTSL